MTELAMPLIGLDLTPLEDHAVSRTLTARAATVAVRVADLLEERCSAGSKAGEAAAFLRTWSDSALSGAVREPAVQPLDNLVRYFSLSAPEVDLLLLAGLPEEHEGVSCTFRQLHPQGDPWPTVGLAALVA